MTPGGGFSEVVFVSHLAPQGAAERSRAVRKLTQGLVNFLKREDGPTAVEYAVMLALIIVVCITAITALGSNANGTFTRVGSAINVGS